MKGSRPTRAAKAAPERAPRAPRPPRDPSKSNRKRGNPEHQLQIDVRKYLDLALPPRHPDVWWTAIDHAHAASRMTGALRKARGVKAGIPDLHILYRGRSIWIELKAPNGSVSLEQKDVRLNIEKAGGFWHEARSREEVRDILLGHGIRLMAHL